MHQGSHSGVFTVVSININYHNSSVFFDAAKKLIALFALAHLADKPWLKVPLADLV